MAKTLEEVLGSLSADEKKLFENTLSKNPDLKAGWTRLEDYTRKTQELAAERTKLQERVDYADQMEAWADKVTPRIESLREKGILDENDEETWTAKQADLEKQLAEARAAAVGGDMDPAELRKNVEAIAKEFGVLSPAELKALVASEASKLAGETFDSKYSAKETEFNEKTIPFVSGFATSMALAAVDYQTETGKKFTDDDTKAVYELMSSKKNYNPREVMAEYMKPHLQQKTDEAEIERRAQEKADEIIKQRGGLPGAGGEPYIPQSDPKGNLQQMLDRSAGDGDFESLISKQAVEAAKALHAEGK